MTGVFLAALVLAPLLGVQPAAMRSGDPLVSPDGSSIAFTSNRDGTPDLYVVPAEGSGISRLTRTPEEETLAGWSADATRLWFAITSNDSSRLFSIDRDGTHQTEIATLPGRTVRLSPDGRHVLYCAGSWTEVRLFVADLDGAHARQLTDGKSVVWGPRWSPDGKSIAFTGRDAAQQLHIVIVNIDTGEQRQVTHLKPGEGRVQTPAWSADGRQLAAQVSEGTGVAATSHIWTIDVASGALRKLAPHTIPYLDEVPSWFPDGKRIAFQSNRTGRMEVWVMNAGGSDQRQLTK
jgi:Tol biopolymer transport system component